MHLNGEVVKCHLKGKTCSKWQMDLIFMIEKENDSRCCSGPALGLYACTLPF